MNAYHVCNYVKHKQKGVTEIRLDSSQIPLEAGKAKNKRFFSIFTPTR